MKVNVARVLLLLILLFPSLLPAQTPPAPEVLTPQIITETVKRATLALYEGKQVCKWNGEEAVCEFKTAFTCTATVISADEGQYNAITAGHCFDWNEVRQHNYYVADTIDDRPVLHRIDMIKFENDDRYDFALISFKSYRDYPVIPLDLKSTNAPALGTQVLNVNFALGITKQVQTGVVVSGIVGPTESTRMKGVRRRYLLNLAAGPGASGSSIVDLQNGKIVGLVEAYFPGTQMPMAVIPTGDRLFNFIDDDSAGLEPKPVEPKPVEPKPTEEPELVKMLFVHKEMVHAVQSVLIFYSLTAIAVLLIVLYGYKVERRRSAVHKA